MIISENVKPTLDEFKDLMLKTDLLLNTEAVGKENYYKGRSGTQLEEDVYDAMTRCAKNTAFEDTIQLISGASFPDIVANQFYGVEVKSTNKNHWKSIGSSIMESTRNQNVERIFLTFCKLGDPIAFLTRPYEDCLSGIAVTHYPRYQIDMELNAGETIFDKLGIPYDTLRKMENPITPVSQYYKKQLKEGESLWWASDSNIEDTAAPPTVRLWSALSREEKDFYTAQGYAFFPEVLDHSSTKKYKRYALWLATNCGIVDTSIRDQFSSGGRKTIETPYGIYENLPASFSRIQKNKKLIADTIISTDDTILKEHWQLYDMPDSPLLYWCQTAALHAGTTKEEAGMYYKLLKELFEI